MKKGDKKGQFYLIASIIIVGALIALTYSSNYYTKKITYEGLYTSEELKIEAEKVLDYELNNPSTALNEFQDFSMKFSDYAKDKEIYFIIVDVDKGIKESYKYTESEKIPIGNLNVGNNEIRFETDKNYYTFPLEKGKNFYSIIIYDKGGERYVHTI